MKVKNNPLIIAVIILATVSLACATLSGSSDTDGNASGGEGQSGQGAGKLGEPERNEEGGYTYAPVQEYTVESFFGVVNQQAPDADPDLGPTILMVGGAAENIHSVDELMDQFKKNAGSSFQVSQPRQISVGGVPALEADLSGTTKNGKKIAGRVVVAMVSPSQKFSMLGTASPERWYQEVLNIFVSELATVQFFEPQTPQETPGSQTPPAPASVSPRAPFHQWAVSATASSEYSDSNWSANQAAGRPNTLDCGDLPTAWASSDGEGMEWIELQYQIAVIPLQVNIHQTQNPNQVVKVELIGVDGAYHEIYSGAPDLVSSCPYIQSIGVENASYLAQGVKISLDQSRMQRPWNEIDAVELVGMQIG